VCNALTNSQQQVRIKADIADVVLFSEMLKYLVRD